MQRRHSAIGCRFVPLSCYANGQTEILTIILYLPYTHHSSMHAEHTGVTYIHCHVIHEQVLKSFIKQNSVVSLVHLKLVTDLHIKKTVNPFLFLLHYTYFQNSSRNRHVVSHAQDNPTITFRS